MADAHSGPVMAIRSLQPHPPYRRIARLLRGSMYRGVMNDALSYALSYAQRFGWRVLPCHNASVKGCSCGRACSAPGKHPRTRRGVHDASDDPTVIRRWWSKWPGANVAIATGEGLLVVDVDPRHSGAESLTTLETELGPLPRDFVAATGGGGFHVYLATPVDRQFRSRNGMRPGVDTKAGGGYVIAPPSRHHSGKTYSWKATRDSAPPTLPPAWLAALPIIPSTNVHPSVGQIVQSSTRNLFSTICLDGSDDHQAILTAVDQALVLTHGTRNHQLVKLARSLKRIERLQNRDAEDLRPIVRLWWERSRDNMRTKDWEASWGQFLNLWVWARPDRCDASAVHAALQQALARPMPAVAERYPCRALRTLVALCKALQDGYSDADGVWYLSCRDAATVLSVEKGVISAWLNLLCRDGVLQKVGERKRGSLRAQRFRYLSGSLVAGDENA